MCGRDQKTSGGGLEGNFLCQNSWTKGGGAGGEFSCQNSWTKGRGGWRGIFLPKFLDKREGGLEGNFPCQNSWTKGRGGSVRFPHMQPRLCQVPTDDRLRLLPCMRKIVSEKYANDCCMKYFARKKCNLDFKDCVCQNQWEDVQLRLCQASTDVCQLSFFDSEVSCVAWDVWQRICAQLVQRYCPAACHDWDQD